MAEKNYNENENSNQPLYVYDHRENMSPLGRKMWEGFSEEELIDESIIVHFFTEADYKSHLRYLDEQKTPPTPTTYTPTNEDGEEIFQDDDGDWRTRSEIKAKREREFNAAYGKKEKRLNDIRVCDNINKFLQRSEIPFFSVWDAYSSLVDFYQDAPQKVHAILKYHQRSPIFEDHVTSERGLACILFVSNESVKEEGKKKKTFTNMLEQYTKKFEECGVLDAMEYILSIYENRLDHEHPLYWSHDFNWENYNRNRGGATSRADCLLGNVLPVKESTGSGKKQSGKKQQILYQILTHMGERSDYWFSVSDLDGHFDVSKSSLGRYLKELVEFKKLIQKRESFTVKGEVHQRLRYRLY